MSRELVKNETAALDALAREELGLNPDDLGSPWGAAIASFIAFALGAVVPLVPFLFGLELQRAVATAAVVAGIALFGVGRRAESVHGSQRAGRRTAHGADRRRRRRCDLADRLAARRSDRLAPERSAQQSLQLIDQAHGARSSRSAMIAAPCRSTSSSSTSRASVRARRSSRQRERPFAPALEPPLGSSAPIATSSPIHCCSTRRRAQNSSKRRQRGRLVEQFALDDPFAVRHDTVPPAPAAHSTVRLLRQIRHADRTRVPTSCA